VTENATTGVHRLHPHLQELEEEVLLHCGSKETELLLLISRTTTRERKRLKKRLLTERKAQRAKSVNS
jgi:hypothetical protein